MKKVFALILSLTLCLSLCACKSADVENAESLIAALNDSSSYQQIHEAYSQYNSLSSKDRQKVENLELLRTYCDPQGGEFTLTTEMIQEIGEEFKQQPSGMTGAQLSIAYDLSIKSLVNGWEKYSNIKITANKQIDRYTYCVYGTFLLVDKFGTTSTKYFEMSYFMEYDDAGGYKLSHSTYVK